MRLESESKSAFFAVVMQLMRLQRLPSISTQRLLGFSSVHRPPPPLSLRSPTSLEGHLRSFPFDFRRRLARRNRAGLSLQPTFLRPPFDSSNSHAETCTPHLVFTLPPLDISSRCFAYSEG
jgi:hypothetical protein